MKKRVIAGLVTAGLVMSITAAGVFAANFTSAVKSEKSSGELESRAANRVDKINPMEATESYPVNEEEMNQSMEDFVKDLDMLTQEEKQRLIDEDKALAPYYKELERLAVEIEKKTNTILKEAQQYYDERAELFDANSELWDKLWDNMNDQQKALNDYIEIIKKSEVLTEKEKEILIKDQTRIEELEAEIDKYYQKAEDATQDLRKEEEKTMQKLQEIMAQNADIWEKVYGSASTE